MKLKEEEIDSKEKKKKFKETIWKPLKPDEIISYEEDVDIEEDNIRNIPLNLKTPYDFYSLFIDDSFLDNLVQHTNEYAQYKKQKNTINKTQEEKNQRKTMAERWTTIDNQKMEKYIAAVILM